MAHVPAARRLLLAFVLLLGLAAGEGSAAVVDQETSPDGIPLRMVLAVDGVPYDLFAEMQARGLFRDFRPVARMVAPFPSLSDVSFAAIGGSDPPAGYQVMRFDPISNRVVGNTLASLSSRAHPNLPADSSDHSSWHRMAGYLAANRVALADMHRIGNELLRSRKATFVAYLEQSDAILHIEGRPGAVRFLNELDGFLQALQEEVRARTGRDLRVDIVSDHGSTLMEGRGVALDRQLRSCGFRRRDRIQAETDVAYSYAGIIGSVAITASPGRVEDVGRCLARTDGVDFVAVDRGDHVRLFSGRGGAEIRPATTPREAYAYRASGADPLRLLDPSAGEREAVFDQERLFQQSLDSAYPDPLRRLWRAFHGVVQHPSPILVSLADGREAGNRTVRGLAIVRGRAGTHGSLTRSASLGILASNWREVEDVDCWRANALLFGAETELALRESAMQRIAQSPRPPSSPVRSRWRFTPADKPPVTPSKAE